MKVAFEFFVGSFDPEAYFFNFTIKIITNFLQNIFFLSTLETETLRVIYVLIHKHSKRSVLKTLSIAIRETSIFLKNSMLFILRQCRKWIYIFYGVKIVMFSSKLFLVQIFD